MPTVSEIETRFMQELAVRHTRPPTPPVERADYAGGTMTAAVTGAQVALAAAPMKVGAWIDCPLTSIDAEYVRRLRACGVTTAAIMTNKMNAVRSAEPWRLLAPETTIVRAANAFRTGGMDVVLTCWPRPSKAQIATLAESMTGLMRDTRAVALEVDLEANWHPRYLDGFKSMKAAATHLVATLRTVANGARVEVTTFPGHAEARPGALVSPHVDTLIPQAYSVRNRSHGKIEWTDELGPGRIQRMAHANAVATGCPHVAMGLAAYDQAWPGRTIGEAMGVAIETTRALGCGEIRYWSSKHIVGKFGQKTVRNAIGGIR